MCFAYHKIISFILFTGGMVFFVLSLEEGFYLYQFKQFGWTMLNLGVIATGMNGMLTALWHSRLWYTYTVLAIALNNLIVFIFDNLKPLGGIKLFSIKPKATLEGHIAGIIATIGMFICTNEFFCSKPWF